MGESLDRALAVQEQRAAATAGAPPVTPAAAPPSDIPTVPSSLDRARAVQQRRAQSTDAPPPSGPEQVGLTGLIDSYTSGVTFSFGDNITAFEAMILGRTPEGRWFDYSVPALKRYDAALDAERAQNARFVQEHPGAAAGAEILGGLSTGIGASKIGLTFAGQAIRTVRPVTAAALAAIEGGVFGALYGAGVSREGELLEGAKTGALQGALFGGVLAGLGGGVARALNRRRFVKAAPSAETVRSGSQAAFKRAADEGIVFGDEVGVAFAEGLADDLHALGFDPSLHPSATAAFTRIRQLVMKQKTTTTALPAPTGGPTMLSSTATVGRSFTLEDFGILRRVVSHAGASREPSERLMAGVMIDAMDDLVDNVKPEMLVGGRNAAIAAGALKEARHMWARFRKSEALDTAFEVARNQASGLENGLRTQFRLLLNNPRKMRGFTPAEQAAMKEVVRGSGVGNLLKLMGKFSFGRSGATNALGGSVGAAGGAAVGGAAGGSAGAIVGGIAVPAVSQLARRGSEAVTVGRAGVANAVVRSGRAVPPVNIPRAAFGALMGGAGVSGGAAAERAQPATPLHPRAMRR